LLLSLHTVKAMKHFTTVLFLLLFSWQVNASIQTKPQDSVGIANKSGSYYIIHEVTARQTLFALTKVYKVSIQDILEANPGMLPAVQTGQLVYIPLKNFKPQPGLIFSLISTEGKLVKEGDEAPQEAPAKEEPKKETPKTDTQPEKPKEVTPTTPAPKEAPADNADDAPLTNSDKFDWKTHNAEYNLYHEVKSGETLYRIATYYGLTVQEIMEINGLESSVIAKGQKLLIKKATKTADKPKEQPKEEKQTNKTPKKDTPKEKPVEVAPEPVINDNPTEIKETGMALVIDKNFPEAEKNIALHTKAPVGTILMVTNPANTRVVYLRVVGKLESDDRDLLLMISPAAANELGAPLTGKVKLTLSYAQ
jgi:LysM repeat protein